MAPASNPMVSAARPTASRPRPRAGSPAEGRWAPFRRRLPCGNSAAGRPEPPIRSCGSVRPGGAARARGWLRSTRRNGPDWPRLALEGGRPHEARPHTANEREAMHGLPGCLRQFRLKVLPGRAAPAMRLRSAIQRPRARGVRRSSSRSSPRTLLRSVQPVWPIDPSRAECSCRYSPATGLSMSPDRSGRSALHWESRHAPV